MAVVVGDKIFVNGDYVGPANGLKDGTVIDIDYDVQPTVVLN